MRLLHGKGLDPNPFPLVSTVWTIVTNLGWYEEPPQLNWWPYGGLSTMTAASMMVPWWCIWHLWHANAMVLPQYPKIQKSEIIVARASVTPVPLWLAIYDITNTGAQLLHKHASFQWLHYREIGKLRCSLGCLSDVVRANGGREWPRSWNSGMFRHFYVNKK